MLDHRLQLMLDQELHPLAIVLKLLSAFLRCPSPLARCLQVLSIFVQSSQPCLIILRPPKCTTHIVYVTAQPVHPKLLPIVFLSEYSQLLHSNAHGNLSASPAVDLFPLSKSAGHTHSSACPTPSAVSFWSVLSVLSICCVISVDYIIHLFITHKSST